MKKNTFLFCLIFTILGIQIANAQPWLNLLPTDKPAEELTLRDYQQAFNAYWDAYNVTDGYFYVDGKKYKAGGWKQFKRWEYYMESVVEEETGKFPDETGMQVVRRHYKTNPEVYEKTSKTSNWSSLGPDNSTGGYAGIGRINCIAFHPDDNNTWWVGAASGGLWVTHNNGNNDWVCLTDNNGVLAVSDIIIPPDYTTSNTIYIATGDRSAGDNNSIGVLKSTDCGATWNETGLTFTISQGRRTNRLLLDPNDYNTIVAAASDGVYKTSDGGENWEKIFTQNFIDLEYKPGDFNTLYGSRGADIWRTTDGGENWEQVIALGQQRTELAVSPDNPNVVYALVSNHSSGLHGIYKSTNSGESFEQIFSGSTLNLLGWSAYGTDNGGQGWYDLCIAASPANADILLVGGVNTWRSTDGGYDFGYISINHWWGEGGVVAVHADKHTLVYRNDGVLFEGNDGGVYISPDNGTSWTDKTNGMRISQMYKLGCSATVPNEIITGLQDNGSKLFSGNNWHDVYGGDGMECIIDHSNVNIQYATIYYGRIYRTTNHWNNNTEISPKTDGAWVTPYIIHPHNPQILFAGYADLWKTENRGNTWTQISNVNASSNKLRHIAICEGNPDVIYMSDQSRKLWRTIDGGNTWKLFNADVAITSLYVKNDDPYTVWHTGGGYNASSVFKSTDGGETWENISAGLPSIPFYSIVYNKYEGRSEHLYVGSEVGVYFKDGDKEWVAYNNGLPNVKIGEIEIYFNAQSPETCRLRAATYGRGLWETPIVLPNLPEKGNITGNEHICELDAAILSLKDYAGAVQWQQSTNGSNWSDIPDATTGYYKTPPVTNSYYCRAKVTLGSTLFTDDVFLEPLPIPETPAITQIENSLVSSIEEGNQWYNQEGVIAGAIEKTFTPTENGTYFTIVTWEGCSSDPSNSILVENLFIGDNTIGGGQFTLFPNPVNDQLTINSVYLKIKRIILTDVQGKEVVNMQKNMGNKATVNVAKIPSGVYQIKIETEKGTFVSKVVKQ